MARTFRRQRQSHPIAELNVTNLIDLGFTLLIIFMVTQPLINQEQTHPINLPSEAKNPQEKPKPEDKFYTVTFDAKGFYLGNQREPVGPVELEAQLQKLAAEPGHEHLVIRIRGDRRTEFQKFVQVIAELNKVNLSRISIDTETSG